MKIDIHTHILPKTWPDLRERYGYGGWISLDHHCAGCARMMMDDRFFREIESNCWDPGVRMTEGDALGVDVQVLSTVPVMFGYWARPEHTHDLSKLLNDHLVSVCAVAPKRFVGLGTVPLQDTARAIAELERCMTLGLAGVEVGTHVNGLGLDDPSLLEFWAACESLGAAVFVHPWDMMGKERLPNYWLPWLVSMPAETSQAICSMMMGGILERFPKLRVAFAHGGGSFPATLGRIDHGFDVRPDLCQTNTTTRPSSLLDRIYVDTLVHDPRVLRYLLDVLGEQRLLLGSDYPFPLGEHHPGAMIEGMDLPSSTKERLLSGSALEWLGKNLDDFRTPASDAHSDALRIRVPSR